ncbi:MAG TPA: hypothetical protein VFK82_11065, partial [Burkholderiaceae bacterium]|nr:hypothetical protein [Burkholderiaceae bacterium]
MSRTPLFDDDADRVLAHYRAATTALADEAAEAGQPAHGPADAQPDPRVRRTVLAVAARQLREVAPAQQASAAPLHTAAGKVRWLRWPKLPVWGNALAATLMVGVLVVAVTPRVQDEAALRQAAGDLNVPTAPVTPASAPAAAPASPSAPAGAPADTAPASQTTAPAPLTAASAPEAPAAAAPQRSAKM